MAVPAVSEFRAEFPEFGTGTSQRDDATIAAALKRAYRLHSAVPAATLYAAAHLIVLDAEKQIEGPDGGAGVVSKESIGTQDVEYMTNAGTDEKKVFWARSPYGREFMKLEERNVRQGFGILIA